MRIASALALAALFLTGDEPATVRRLTTDGLDKHRPMWAPDGKRLLVARELPDASSIFLEWLDLEGATKPKRLTDRKETEYQGAISPDGTRVLLTVVPRSGTQGNCDVAIVGADGSGLKTIVGDRDGALSHQDWPSWSPDGSRFAFASTHEGNQEIYTAKADGSDARRVTQSPGLDTHPCWSPDGSRIVFATDRWGGLEIASVTPDGSDLRRLTESPGLDDYPSVSPDGKRMVFVSNRDGNFELYRAEIDGSGPTNLSRSPWRETMPAWSPDGRSIVYVSNRGGEIDLYVLDPEGGEGAD